MAITARVAVSMTETVPAFWLAAYALVPFGEKLMPVTSSPTGMVATTVFVAVAMTDTAWLAPT